MTIKNLKLLLHIIKKNAQGAPPIDGDNPRPSASPAPSIDEDVTKIQKGLPRNNQQRRHAPVAPKEMPIPTNNVGKMQRAILDFAMMAQSTDATAFESGKQTNRGQNMPAIPAGGFGGGDQKTQQSQQDTTSSPLASISPTSSSLSPEMSSGESEKLFGSDAIGNFLMKQYIHNPGNQYANVDVTYAEGRDVTGRGAIDAQNIRGLIESMKRIGTPKPEGKPKPGEKQPKFVGRGENIEDGIWDDRTNNALKNIAALIGAVLNFSKDMGKKLQGYTENDLEQFKDGVPSNPNQFSKEDKEEYSAAFTQHIRAMIVLYRNFKQQILENKTYQKLISQESSFGKIDGEKPLVKAPKDWIDKSNSGVVASPENIEKAKKYFDAYKDESSDPNFFGVKTTYSDIPMQFNYSDLSDINLFKEKVKAYLKKEPTNDDIAGVISSIRSSAKNVSPTQQITAPIYERWK